MAHDVFISYSTKNKVVADAVCAKLEENGIRVWIAPRDVPAGENFANSIIAAIDSCKVFVLIWSEHTSEHILTEINHAFDQNLLIIPFRIQDIQPTNELRYYLGRTHWLDAIDLPLEKHIMALIRTVRAHLDVMEEQTGSSLVDEKPIEPPKIERLILTENRTKEAVRRKIPKTLFFIGGVLVMLVLVLVIVLQSLNGSRLADQLSTSTSPAAQQTEVVNQAANDTSNADQFPSDLAGDWKTDDLHASDGSWVMPYTTYFRFVDGQQIVFHGDSEYLNDQPADIADIVYVDIKESTFVKKITEKADYPEVVGKFEKWTWRFDNGIVHFTIYSTTDSLDLALNDTVVTGLATGFYVK